MIPNLFVDVDALPLTPNGKLDQKALPDPFHETMAADSYVAPRTEMEQRVAQIWCEVLGIERAGVHDNFIELGGHSLLSIQVIALMENKTGVYVSPRAMIMDTLEQVAAEIERSTDKPNSAAKNATSISLLGRKLLSRIMRIV